MADEFLQVATQAPHPIHVAASNALSAFSFSIGIVFASRVFPDVLINLKSRGHKIVYRGGYIGESNGIMITNEGFFGGGDCRGETSSVGY